MLSNFKSFIVNESWKDDAISKSIDLSSSIIDNDQIEDYFLELIEFGFSFKSDFKISFGPKDSSRQIERKNDLINNKCYPLYEIHLSKSFNNDSNIRQTKNKIKLYDSYIDKYEIAINRIEHIHNGVTSFQNHVLISNNSIKFTCKLKINIEIPSDIVMQDVSDKEKRKILLKNPYYRIYEFLEKNRIFTVDMINSIKDKTIRFSVDEKYQQLDIDRIISSVLKNTTANNYKITKIDNTNYKISIL